MPRPSENSVTIPLNGRTLQVGDCIVVICPEESTKNALIVYNGVDWANVGTLLYDCSNTPANDSVNVVASYDTAIYYFYACFIPSPTST